MTQIEELLWTWRLPSIPTLGLYAATLVAEIPVILTRILLTFAVVAIVLVIKGENPFAAGIPAELALIPTGWAIFALVTPLGGGWWWRANMGGRDPSERERTAYNDAIELLQAHTNMPLWLPSLWFVTDEPQPDAAVCGETLLLSRGLLENEYLPAVLAHELAHLATSDGRLTAAINRLIVNPLPKTREKQERQGNNVVVLGTERLLLAVTLFGATLWAARLVIRFARGGLGLRFLGAAWGGYWREREYTADQYAATLGQADELADFLEVHELIHDHPVPFIWLTEHTHPPTELRINQLRKATNRQGAQPLPPPRNAQHDPELAA
jgi:Zn-dependent protease with chaperone function